VSGKSIAGGFVDILACSSISHYFAAFAMASGAFYRDKPGSSSRSSDSINSDTTSSTIFSKSHSNHALSMNTAQCHHKPLTPIINIHGLADDTIPYNGSPDRKGRMLPSIPSYLQTWAKRNGCQEPYYAMKNTSIHHHQATLMQWMCDSSSGGGGGGDGSDNDGVGYRPDIDHYAVRELKHAWPALMPNDDGPVSVIDGSEVIYNFFNQWSSDFTG